MLLNELIDLTEQAVCEITLRKAPREDFPSALANLTEKFNFSVANGDLLFLENGWYVTHSGLMSLASRRRCAGIRTQPVLPFCDPSGQRWAFGATIFKSRACKGFVGYGDAYPSNVSDLVRGAEMRVSISEIHQGGGQPDFMRQCSLNSMGFHSSDLLSRAVS